MNIAIDPNSFFIIQVWDGRGAFGFQICLTDDCLARQLLETFGRDLLGRRIALYSLDEPPVDADKLAAFRSMTKRMGQILERCQSEPSPGRAFLVAYVEQWREQTPLSVIASFLEHAKYEPDHDEFDYVPLHQSAIGRAYP
ncbi:hypothetical protein [Pseudomonas sp. dw_358]|uniref:hypothetical protein n=1 Tax=Pseudomonas sp. dw_358 TaxID=2720083 RepID=UPI001BD4779E|nr:hypothetical protein [Pseudomonas sp. dw_358]